MSVNLRANGVPLKNLSRDFLRDQMYRQLSDYSSECLRGFCKSILRDKKSDLRNTFEYGFVDAWQTSKSLQEVTKALGMGRMAATRLAIRMRKRGVPLKKFNRLGFRNY